jgi:hypothetical protein
VTSANFKAEVQYSLVLWRIPAWLEQVKEYLNGLPPEEKQNFEKKATRFFYSIIQS